MAEQHKRTRRGFIKTTGAAGAVGLGGLAGCIGGDESNQGQGGGTKGGSKSGETDKIVFYNAGSLEYDKGTEENIKRFEEETGVTVEVNEVPWDNLKTSLTTIWKNQDSKVDAFNGPTWWLSDFVSSQWIDPLGLEDDHLGNYPENLQELVTFDGEAYMAPEFGKWGTYLYDEQYLSENGFDAPPDTWDEMLEQGEELSSGDRAGFGFTWDNKDVFTFKQYLYKAGGRLFNDDNEPVFHEEGADVMEFFTQLRERGVLPNGISSMGEGGLGDSFIAGQFATVEAWTPLGSRALESDEWGDERIGSAKPVKGPEGRATFQDTNGIAVSAFSERKETAKEFARFMTTQESSKTNMLVEGNPSVVPAVYEDSEVQDEYPSWLLEDMKFNLEHAQSESYVAQPQIDDYLSEQITPALLGEKDPQEALTEAKDNIERLYQDIGLL